MQDLNEYMPTIPSKKVDVNVGYNSARKVLQKLFNILRNDQANSAFYDHLENAYLSKKIDKYEDLQIEVIPGRFVPIYFYFLNGIYGERKDSSAGSFGPNRRPNTKSKLANWLIKEISGTARIKMGLYNDPNERFIYWDKNYEQTLIHEVTHLYQTLDKAVRAQKMNKVVFNKKDNLMKNLYKFTTKKQGSGKYLKMSDEADNMQDWVRYRLAYYDNDAEIGAYAATILDQLDKYYTAEKVMPFIISHLNFGNPSLRQIDQELLNDRNFQNSGWSTLTALGQYEMEAFKISRIEFTKSYEIKEKILKAMGRMYKTHKFKRR